jgi:S-layer homology domain
MNQSNLAILGKIALAAACLAIISPISSAKAVSSFTDGVRQNAERRVPELLLADGDDDDDDDDDDKKTQAELPEEVKTVILSNISQNAGVEVSNLRIVKAEKQVWTNGCLNLKAESDCTQAEVPGWQVVVASEKQMWVYRTDESGAIAKLDQESTQIASTAMMRTATTMERRISTSSVQRQAVTTRNSKKIGLTLTILQPSGSFSDVIARVSVKNKRGKKYYKERFLGDYKYKIKQKAKFVKGLKAGDRMVVRLYDSQNRFIGYSEFECLQANTAVNLILSENPTGYKVVRTVYGADADFDDRIDVNTTTYDYFTQVSDQRVTFLESSRQVKISQFQAQGLSAVATKSLYTASFTRGEYALVSQSISAFSSESADAIQATPGSLVQLTEVSDDGSSTYDVTQLMMNYREVGVAKGIQVKFSDVSTNYWAKDFIAELAALEIIEGFPDGNFRPDEQVTRAQFAAMLSQAFEKVKIRKAKKFRDVSAGYWAYNAITEAYQMGFLADFGNEFNPKQSLSRLETLLAIAGGLNYTVSGSTETILTTYSDATTIRSDVRNAIAALTQKGIIVNYPDVTTLNADKVATRAEVSALIYKALVSTGEVADISSAVGQARGETEIEQVAEGEPEKTRRHCNQGIGNGAEGCDPGNSRPHGGSNDEGGRTPGAKR